MNVLSFADLYAGKIVAALDRQHPRDLFDVHLLLEREGLGDDLRTALIIYLISHDHSPHSLLSPKLRDDVERSFESDFVGMTEMPVSLETLLSARDRLIADIKAGMSDDHKAFLVSFYRGDPQWDKLGLPDIAELPAIRWRQLNLDKAGEGTREEIVKNLREILGL